MTTQYLRPDWVLLGISNGDGSVTVFGSLEMDEAELNVEMNWHRFRHFQTIVSERNPSPSYRARLTATMKRYAMANGATYAEALALLFREWDADQQRTGAPNPITNRKAIGP